MLNSDIRESNLHICFRHSDQISVIIPPEGEHKVFILKSWPTCFDELKFGALLSDRAKELDLVNRHIQGKRKKGKGKAFKVPVTGEQSPEHVLWSNKDTMRDIDTRAKNQRPTPCMGANFANISVTLGQRLANANFMQFTCDRKVTLECIR